MAKVAAIAAVDSGETGKKSGNSRVLSLDVNAICTSWAKLRERRSLMVPRTLDGACICGIQMTKFDDRTMANIDVVLDDVCRDLPNNGGDHESRKFIALRLVRAAQRGKKSLGALSTVARQAMHKLSRRRSGDTTFR
jgi:hypothetical protein